MNLDNEKEQAAIIELAGIAKALADCGRKSEAVAKLTDALKIQNKWTNVRQVIEILLEIDACQEATKILQSAIEKDPSQAENIFELATAVFKKTGHIDILENWYNDILRKGPNAVVITRGAEGVTLFNEKGRKEFPSFRVKAVDTVGAGDAFNGGFAAALAEGQTVEDALRFAQAAAAISVTRLGAQPSMPKREEILEMLE